MSRPQQYRVQVGERPIDVELKLGDDGVMRATVGDSTFAVTRAPDGSWSVRDDGGTTQRRVWLDRTPSRASYAAVDGDTAPVAVQTAAEAALEAALLESAGGAGAAGAVKAPMPGRVVKALVAEGDTVEAGQPVIIVEAMKMENEVAAPGAGVVQRIAVSAGDTVDAGVILVELAPHDDA